VNSKVNQRCKITRCSAPGRERRIQTSTKDEGSLPYDIRRPHQASAAGHAVNIIASTVSLTVADVAASSRFLTTHLGFREVALTEEFTRLARDDAAVDIELWVGERTPATAVVSFTVTGITAEHERLLHEGANVSTALRLEPWGEWSLRLTDPNGVVIQLVEWAPPAGF
jgi:catechol 2,3-dioxygenase-like lactoylglutathione lyase family enzyme